MNMRGTWCFPKLSYGDIRHGLQGEKCMCLETEVHPSGPLVIHSVHSDPGVLYLRREKTETCVFWSHF